MNNYDNDRKECMQKVICLVLGGDPLMRLDDPIPTVPFPLTILPPPANFSIKFAVCCNYTYCKCIYVVSGVH